MDLLSIEKAERRACTNIIRA